MSWFSFKKDRVLPILTLAFLAWAIFLVLMGLLGSRDVIFYDYQSLNPVTTEYTSAIPLLRYLFEPLIGVTMIIGKEFTWIITFVLFYVIFRIVYSIFRKKEMIKSEKYKVLAQIIENYLIFIVHIALIMTVAVLMFIGIGYAFYGFLFLNYYWQISLQIGLTIITVVILFKLGLLIFRYYRPKKNLSHKNMSKKSSNSSLKKFLKISRKEFRLFLAIAFLLVMVNFLLLTIPFPTQKIITDKEDFGSHKEYIFDFHVHTYMSDGFLSPEERVQWYIAQDVDGAAFTDHENQRGYIRARDYVERNGLDFVVIAGQEYTYSAIDIHLNIFGMNETIVPPSVPPAFGEIQLNVSDMIAYVHSKGGFVVVNHYHKNASAPYSYEQLLNWSVDGFEIVNGGSLFPIEIRNFCRSNNLACISASDCHTNQELNSFVKINLTDHTNLTEIFVTLKLNTHQAIQVIHYPEKVSIPSPLALFDAFNIWLNYFLNLDIFQILSWICWSCGGFLFSVFIYRRLKKADINKLKEILEK